MLAAPAQLAAAEPPEHIWSRAFTATPVDTFNAFVAVSDIIRDPTGGVVIVGPFHGSADFGGGAIVSRSFASGWEGSDAYAAKFDASGNCAWSHVLLRLGEFLVHSEIIRSLAVGNDGNLIIVGVLNGPVDFVGTTLVSNFLDAFVARYTPDDGLRWAKRFGITGPLFGNSAQGVAVDADDNIVVIGSFSGRIDFGGGVMQSFGASDVFLAKLDTAGGHVWSRRYGGAGYEEGRSVAIDDAGHIHVAGTGEIDLGGGPLAPGNFFTGELDASAMHIRSNAMRVDSGGPQLQPQGSPLLLNETGNLCMVGNLLSNSFVTFGGQTLYGPLGYLAFFDATVAYRWHSTWELNRDVRVSFDAGTIDMCGSFSGTLEIGDRSLVSVGGADAYIARFDQDGAPIWALSFGGPGDDRADATLAGTDDELWVGGRFSDGIELGDATYSGSAGFLARFVHVPPAPIMEVSLFPSTGAIEVRWNVTTEQPVDTLTVLRGTPPASPAPVFTTLFGSGSGSFVDGDVVGGRVYQYQLVVTTPQGVEYRSSTVTATPNVPTFVNTLAQNAPNPFNPTTSIAYSLKNRAEVSISIYDATGIRVRRIEEGVRDAGEHIVEWDGRDDTGNVVGTGVYFYRLEGVPGVAPRKMVLIK